MKRFAVLLLVVVCGPALADHSKKPKGRVELLEGLGEHRHPVGTRNEAAQLFFDQGLALLYAFNHDEAGRAFARAAELDPNLAMAHWGIALSKGPNYNLDADDEQWKAACAAASTAAKLAENAPEPDRDYVRTLAKRFPADPKSDRKQAAIAYKEAMGELARKYPDDLDAATLYAESAMNLRPWKLWTADGTPAEGTEEIVAVLESVLRRNPDHPGANHYYIHAVEASRTPERALPSARRLTTLAPAAGHLVHMPSHIFFRVGDYAAAAEANEKAVVADEAYLERSGAAGVYPMMYFSHNIHFLAIARCYEGRYADAKKAADRLAAHIGPHVAAMPMLEGFLTTPPQLLVRFGRWDEILAAPVPGEKQAIAGATWRFARACAYLAKGDADRAGQERERFLAVKKSIPEDAKVSDWNTAKDVFGIAEHVLEAKFAQARKEPWRAIERLREAVKIEDTLAYGEPPDWIAPAREALGAALLLHGEPVEAEKVFRDALARHPRSGRGLFGLRESLKAAGKEHAARFVDQEFRAAWKNADVKELKLADF